MTPRECIAEAVADGRTAGRDGVKHVGRGSLKRADAVLAALDAAGFAVVPKEPTEGLLVSMAIRYDHSFGLPARTVFGAQIGHTNQQRKSILTTMLQLHEEVVGLGFYRPEKEGQYRAALAQAQEARS